MKKTLHYTSLSALALLAAVTLAACGGNAEKTTASSSKEASSSKVTKESSSKTEASQKEEQKSETSSSSATGSQTETKAENQKDYSKFLGTWENYAGTTATVTADGIVTIQSSKGTFKYEMDKVEEKDGYYLTGIHLVDGGEGARLIFTPAGVANELTGTDGSQDVLAIGQSPSDKDSHFYRN